MTNRQSKLRRCSACSKQFASDLGIENHIRDKHKGEAERLPVQKSPTQQRREASETSMASQVIDARLNYAMGEPVEDYLMDMFEDEITGGQS